MRFFREGTAAKGSLVRDIEGYTLTRCTSVRQMAPKIDRLKFERRFIWPTQSSLEPSTYKCRLRCSKRAQETQRPKEAGDSSPEMYTEPRSPTSSSTVKIGNKS